MTDRSDGFNNLYVNENGKYDGINVDSHVVRNDNPRRVMNRKIRNNSRSKIRTSKRLAKGKASISTNELEDGMVGDEIETDDDLYAFTDEDEMGVDYDDYIYSSLVTDEIENDSKTTGFLSGYESNDYVETENDSNSEFENDLMGSCLNVDEFSIPEGEKFRLLQGMTFADVYPFRKVL
ncbi:hypothetical protein ACH5RR_015001 [Cinchona calisaya]|uniref:Uncharacterized protein n=1 Tax=Cinchona calisaya TaxID=153742 RepID=A0ABD2ZVG7_9GENT